MPSPPKPHRKNAHPEMLRDVAPVLLPELKRTLEMGIKAAFIQEVAKVGKTQITDILADRRTRVTVRTHGDLLDACIAIQEGEVEIPDSARRFVPGKAAFSRQSGSNDECIRGHKRTPENTYIAPRTGNPQCRECQRMSRKSYRERHREKELAAHRAAAKKRYWRRKGEAA